MALMILPLWPTQVWFPAALQILAADPVLLPRCPLLFSATANSCTPSGSGVGLDSDGALLAAFTRRGLSTEVAQFILRSWRSNTKAQYGPRINNWLSFCLGRKLIRFYHL